MTHIFIFGLGLFFGVFLGVALAAIMVVSEEQDEKTEEEIWREKHQDAIAKRMMEGK